MTIEELKKEALEAKRRNGFVVLRVPRGKYPKRFPRGELLEETEKYRVYGFMPEKILKWIEKLEKEVGGVK
jgi:hypothetical protein